MKKEFNGPRSHKVWETLDYHNNMFIILMATNIGHNGHHQAISQNL